MVGFCSSPRFVEHETGASHPERPDRIRAIYRAVTQSRLITSPDPFPDFKVDLRLPPARVAPLVELEAIAAEEKWLRTVHTDAHIARVKHVCAIGGGVLDQGDTPVCPASYDIAMLAVGAVLRCCDAVRSGETRRAFAAVRPPGHHAEPDRPMGFCLFSNVAIGARYLQQQHSLNRIAIVDFDVHHGNGTQAAFEADESVLFISLHQHPSTCYPGSGHAWEKGVRGGLGSTINIAMQPGSDDADYDAAFASIVLPALDAFRPDALMISAGFDAHRDDPLAGMNLSDEAYETMTRALVSAADRLCNGRVVSVLEGGYNLAALGRGVVRHLVSLSSGEAG